MTTTMRTRAHFIAIRRRRLPARLSLGAAIDERRLREDGKERKRASRARRERASTEEDDDAVGSDDETVEGGTGRVGGGRCIDTRTFGTYTDVLE